MFTVTIVTATYMDGHYENLDMYNKQLNYLTLFGIV